MKYFPLLLHIILMCAVGGFAYGANKAGFSPAIVCTAQGVAVGLGFTMMVRLFLGI